MVERERGQLLPMVAVIIAMTGVLALAVGRIGAGMIGRARAQAAADAAALAGVMRGRAAAESLAAGNGAVVVTYTEVGTDVRVTVRGPTGQTAVAQARAAPPVSPGDGLAPAMRAALARAAQVAGRTAPLPVVEVGADGLTVQVGDDVVPALVGRSRDSGLCPQPELGPNWFGICGPAAPSVG